MVDAHAPHAGQERARRRPKPTTREQVIAAGFSGDLDVVQRHNTSHDPAVRIAVLNALLRLGYLTVPVVIEALADDDASVIRRALELSSAVKGRGSKTTLIVAIIDQLQSNEPLVVDAACWALGERQAVAGVEALCGVAANHTDPRCREAAVAGLGAIGDERGLPTILARLDDKPNIRRRVVVALASFEGGDVDAALERCSVDHDWQVRQAVTMLQRNSPFS